jgi:two-component system cell cycle sensor histidine kinase/response regulator CckA
MNDGDATMQQGGHVLYVDDDEPLVFLVTRLLRRLGYEPEGFTEPALALEAFKKAPGQFALVLTDLSMPGANGLDFAQEVLATSPHTKVAILSSYVEPADVTRAAAMGILAVERKPLTVEELGPVLQRLLM